MEWKNKNVFITGADGFIGSNLAKALVEKKANIVVVIRDFKSKNMLDIQEIREKVTLVQGDIIDFPLIQRIMNEYSIDTVFHLAAQALVGVANSSPLSTFESNIRGTYNLLEACRRNRETIKACSETGLSLEEFMGLGLEAMQGIAGELKL